MNANHLIIKCQGEELKHHMIKTNECTHKASSFLLQVATTAEANQLNSSSHSWWFSMKCCRWSYLKLCVHLGFFLTACFIFCRGFISLGDRSYVLEPHADHFDGTHRIYRAEHLNFVPGSCGHQFNVSSPTMLSNSSSFKAFRSRVRLSVLPFIYFFFIIFAGIGQYD